MDADTRQQILDVAQELTQQRGFNAFSYRDIAAQVGIRGPSIHYHFPSKDDLGVALIERCRQQFGRQRAAIDRQESVRTRLRKYAQLFRATAADAGKMCLCGMLAAEFGALPKEMQVGVRGFFDDNEGWLAGVLELGRSRGELQFAESSGDRAESVFSTLEGAMLSARVARDTSKFDHIVDVLLGGLAA
jgi:TetR/AcrR family transcriptional regulator, transcriptional repressor for nem operon